MRPTTLCPDRLADTSTRSRLISETLEANSGQLEENEAVARTLGSTSGLIVLLNLKRFFSGISKGSLSISLYVVSSELLYIFSSELLCVFSSALLLFAPSVRKLRNGFSPRDRFIRKYGLSRVAFAGISKERKRMYYCHFRSIYFIE